MTPHATHRKRRGMTLLEVVIATAVFVTLAAGVLGTTVMTRRTMNQALVRNIAFDAAQGFLDQLKGRSFETLRNVMNNSANGANNNPNPKPGNALLTLTTNDVRHQSIAYVSVAANTRAGDYLTLKNLPDGDQRIPINTTNPNEDNTAKGAQDALGSMSYIPEYGIRVTLTPVTDNPPANADGTPNAIRITVCYRYKVSPGLPDSEFKTGAVTHLLPNI